MIVIQDSAGQPLTIVAGGRTARPRVLIHIGEIAYAPDDLEDLVLEAVERLGARVPCACGCGKMRFLRSADGSERRYIQGHNDTGRRKTRAQIPCACGCGTLIAARDAQGKPRRYARYHQQKIGRVWPKGVYVEHGERLTAQFRRRHEGKCLTLYVGRGALGDFSAETAEQLARACAAAALAWDAAHGRGAP